MSTTTAKERPIPMSAPMVQAILEGRKTQTRRIIKPQPYLDAQNNLIGKWNYGQDLYGSHILPFKSMLSECPYGKTGDRLWVQETFFEVYNNQFQPTGKYCYAATHQGYVNVLDEDGGIKINKDGSEASPWKPSIHMPRKASRILLEITEIKIEQLQEITSSDARKEGIEHITIDEYDFLGLWKDYTGKSDGFPSEIDSFFSLWEKIKGPGSVSLNPWVWVIKFNILTINGK